MQNTQLDAEKIIDMFKAWPEDMQLQAITAGMHAVYESMAGKETADKCMSRFIADQEGSSSN